jgi:putative hydrolase of the HAD superfamily
MCERFGIDPKAAVLVEDMAQNLRPAKALGMTTVWVDNGSERGAHRSGEGHIDLVIGDVGDWLETILGDEANDD